MSATLGILPARPLRARPPSLRLRMVWMVVAGLMLGGFLAFLVAWVAPDLATDAAIRDVAVPIRSGHLAGGSCTMKLFINFCDIDLTANGPAGEIARSVHYIFGSFTLDGFTVAIIGDPRHPDWLTTDLGLDHFWDRVITLVAFLGVCLAGAYGIVRTVVTLLRTGRFWRVEPAVPTRLELLSIRRNRGTAVWKVRADTGAVTDWVMPGKAKPFALDAGKGVLGLAASRTGAVMPLDEKLRWVDLSAGERAAALAARG